MYCVSKRQSARKASQHVVLVKIHLNVFNLRRRRFGGGGIESQLLFKLGQQLVNEMSHLVRLFEDKS